MCRTRGTLLLLNFSIHTNRCRIAYAYEDARRAVHVHHACVRLVALVHARVRRVGFVRHAISFVSFLCAMRSRGCNTRTAFSAAISTTLSGMRKYFTVLPRTYSSGTCQKREPSLALRVTSRKFRFIHASIFTRCPLYVSPFFSSTSCASARPHVRRCAAVQRGAQTHDF